MSKITDTDRIEFLERQNKGKTCVFRQSTTGRGWRLHQTSEYECVALTGHGPLKTVRDAIDEAINSSPTPTRTNEPQMDGHNA